MDVVAPADAAAFLERADPLLLADEARHNLLLGIAGTVRDRPEAWPDHGFWLAVDSGTVAGAALRTRPLSLVVARGSDAAVAALARAIDEPLPGVVGAVPEVDRFVEARGAAAEVRFRQGVYALGEVVPARPVPGARRSAGAADVPLLRSWWRAFAVEALGEPDPDESRLAADVDRKLSDPAGGVALWEDAGRPVCAVGFGNPTPSGIRIGPVYTPPEARGRGYASALTAEVSAEQLAGGRRFCFLYTNLANATANRIYTAIGYRLVCESVEYAFVPSG
jgi:GNAT superfamily N-acetyltransferase